MLAAQYQESYIFPTIFLELFAPLTPQWSPCAAGYNTATIDSYNTTTVIVLAIIIAPRSDTVTDTNAHAALVNTKLGEMKSCIDTQNGPPW